MRFKTSLRAIRSARSRKERIHKFVIILAPAAVIPRVLEILSRRSNKLIRGAISSSAIRDAVWSALQDLEADPIRYRDFEGVREAWERYDVSRRGSQRVSVARKQEPSVPISPTPLNVRIGTDKSHGSIWGKGVHRLKDIPLPARRLFKEICRVEGIAEIRLGVFKEGHSVKGAVAEILASKTGGVIEGKCYANGKKGQVQMFQIRVHDKDRTEVIRRAVMKHLENQRLLRIRETDRI